jgi:pyruvate/2-oxoglutarate dehydrogenase complex dihydrolipoamide acyltransferase (E2) component
MSEYNIYPFPRGREIVVDAGYLGAGRHIIHGLVEVDVTRARALIRQRALAAGDKLSFTAFVVACLGRAIAADPRVQAYRDWRGRLVVFNDADVVTMIEPAAGKVAIPHIIRAASSRSVAEISAEIRAVQARPAGSAQHGGLVELAPRLPRALRMLFFWAIKKSPERFKALEGTAVVTSVGMFGSGGGWGIGFLPTHTLGLTVGGIVQKPGLHEGQIVPRDYLHLTASFDHDIVDGAPAARFTQRLVDYLETAELLDDDQWTGVS